MLIDQLFEDVNDDIKASQYAEKYRLALIDYIKKGFMRGNMVINVKTGDSEIDTLTKGLSIYFGDDSHYYFGINEYGNPIIHMGGGFVDDIPKLNGGYASTFRHEFQHFLDHQRKKTNNPLSYYDENDLGTDKYYNNPHEYNAIFHEVAEPILSVLRDVANGDKISKKLEPDFRRYIKTQHFFNNPYHDNNFDITYRAKLMRRLYKLHSAAISIQGVTERYHLNISERLILLARSILEKISKLY